MQIVYLFTYLPTYNLKVAFYLHLVKVFVSATSGPSAAGTSLQNTVLSRIPLLSHCTYICLTRAVNKSARALGPGHQSH